VGEHVTDAGFTAVISFLSKWDPANATGLNNWEELAGGNSVFRMDGARQYIHERPLLRDAWIDYRGNVSSGTDGFCLVTGKRSPIARLHPAIKGVRDAQSSGAALVTFNLDAFRSYQKKQNLNAPIGEESAFAYTTALNHLLSRSSTQKIQIGDATAIFWTERDSEVEGMLGMVLDPKEAEIADNADLRNFLEAVRQGKHPEGIDANVKFYILGLSPNAARLAVRFWHVCSVGELEDRIGQHFRNLQLQRSFDSEPEYPGIRRILWETYNKKSKTETASPLLAGTLMRCILEGTPYPQALQNAVINRIRADQDINYVRAAILKAILVRKHRNQGMEVKMALDTENKNPAYLLGRLFAVLEKAQTDALGKNINATIKDRFFGAASATPKVVFPQLIRLSQHHIEKAEYGHVNDKRIEEILCDVTEFPAHLSLDEQSIFILGYYHQRQDLFTKKEKQQ
jgi:CRISPR-associated protein Csd1